MESHFDFDLQMEMRKMYKAGEKPDSLAASHPDHVEEAGRLFQTDH